MRNPDFNVLTGPGAAAHLVLCARAIRCSSSHPQFGRDFARAADTLVRVAEIVALSDLARRRVASLVAVEAMEIAEISERVMRTRITEDLATSITRLLALPAQHLERLLTAEAEQLRIAAETLAERALPQTNDDAAVKTGSWLSPRLSLKEMRRVTRDAVSLTQDGARMVTDAVSGGITATRQAVIDTADMAQNGINAIRQEISGRAGAALVSGATVGIIAAIAFPPLAPAAVGLAAIYEITRVREVRDDSSSVVTPVTIASTAFRDDMVHVFSRPGGEPEGIVFAGPFRGNILSDLIAEEMKTLLTGKTY